ncbi:MAG TPA: hypothetical protein VJ719_07795 [Chthoniobacterales bacterium]|nr:hypothetical protein [Chthoniobacterales bacterium]
MRRVGRILVGASLLVGVSSAAATILPWPSSPGWTAGAPLPGQTRSQSFTAVDPNDVTVSINNNGASASGASWSAGYPAINSTLLNGGNPGTNGLQLFLTAQSSTTSYVQVTVTFAAPVINLSVQLWDVDASDQYKDTITQIQGLAQGGGIVAADTITSAVAGYNTITGSGLSTVVTGTAQASNTTNQGTIDINFVQPITEFSFRYSNTDADLGSQGIGLGPMSFVVVPEHTNSLVFLVLFAAIALQFARQRSQFRSTPKL